MSMPSVLLVEDNAVTRRMLRQVLESSGYSVLEAQDGATALGLMEMHHPALVVQELELPDMDGYGLATELRRRAREVTIVALTGFPSSGEAARISAAGIDDIITKPIEPTRLVPIIESHMPRTAPAAERFGVGRSLVVADDDPLNLKLTRLHLTRLGFEVVTAENGVQALERVRQVRPDALISDVLMPRMDGFDLAVALREDPAFGSLPIILLTSSYVEVSDRELAVRAGANELVFRTPELAELIDALRRALSPANASRRVSSAVAGTQAAERIPRMVRGLERQVTLNAGLARRSAQRSAELTVLTAMSEAVLRNRDLDRALDEALAACFDAGGIAGGALYLLAQDGTLRVRSAGTTVAPAAIESFFGSELWLRRIIADGLVVQLGQPPLPHEIAGAVLSAWDADTGFIAPLLYADRPLGAVVMVSRGEQFRGEDAMAFARGVGNQLAQVVALASAFADREAAERRASAQASVLDALLRDAPDLVMRVDANGRILFLNRPVGGRSPESLSGASWLTWIAPEHHDRATDVLREVMATGRAAECDVSGLDDPPRWHSLRLRPVTAEGGAGGVVVIARDSTEVRNTQARLLVADRMASIGTLVEGVVQEINDPLAAVLANLDLALADLRKLEARALPAGIADALRDARDGAEQVRQILRDLGVFARPTAAVGEPVDVHRVLESTLRLAWSQIRHRARLTKHFRSVPAVAADEALLAQVFLNLILNAAEAIPEGDVDANEIRVETATDAVGRVVVTVADSGPGIEPEIRERVFTPFFTTKTDGTGTGLGLAISRRLVEEAGGEIGFDSHPSRGTVFNVALPSSPHVPHRAEQARARPVAPVRRGRILVVEDDPMMGQTIRRILETDHDVTLVRSARAALAQIASGARWDVILSDLMMPQMTGMQLYDEIVRVRPDLVEHLVFITGGAFTARARDFLARVQNARIEKPVEIAVLRDTINALVR
jgi:PAS domain S-box-containing protein